MLRRVTPSIFGSRFSTRCAVAAATSGSCFTFNTQLLSSMSVNSIRANSTTTNAASDMTEKPNLETILTGTNGQWLDQMFESWVEDASSVPPSFAAFFKQVESMDPITMTGSGPVPSGFASSSSSSSSDIPCKGKRWLEAFKNSTSPESQKVLTMILEFEVSGHTVASLDPLNYVKEPGRNPLNNRKVKLTPEHLGISDKDLDMEVPIGFCDNLGGIFRSTTASMKLRELHERLTKHYTGNIGWEYMHINNFKVTQWLRNNIENTETPSVDRKAILGDLADAVAFEKFCKNKYGNTKRFGLEGGEALVPGLRALVNRSVDKHGARKFVLGMAHRGRLNVLVNCCGKPAQAIFKEFDAITRKDLPDDGRQGDVKYHLGWLSEKLKSTEGKDYSMQLMFNPSHLEAVNPLVQGFTRCLQDTTSHENPMASAIPITIHGDAAFAGQGIVYEDMGVSELPKYTTGGTIHVVINNQVGYTTNPADSRSSLHASDIARCFECPIFHVNGDKPEDVVRVFNLAADYRATFNKSVCIDFVCYRRRGHNEGDEASMTQPGMYKLIEKMPNVFDKYKEELSSNKIFEEEEADEMFSERMDALRDEKEKAQEFDYKEFLEAPPKNWQEHAPASGDAAQMDDNTCISASLYNKIAKALITFPDGFKAGSKMENIYELRAEGLKSGSVDYATAEALAIGSLLAEGYSFRISGQDVQRGTFSHRHAVVHDEQTGNQHTPLKELEKSFTKASDHPSQRPHFSVTNSALSEFGVMGYDAGYSLVSPKRVAMWEAQFGDFYNGAQTIIDQFLVSGFTKWGLQYNTIISLPHGYDGQGPEHSSARMERFLQLVSEDESTPDFATEASQHWNNNIEIIVPSCSQSYFHLLRRFVGRNFRRPTFIFFSKSLLKTPTSTLEDFTQGKFLPVIPDSTATVHNDNEIQKVVLTQGQLYHDIVKEVKKRELTNVAVIRIEQLAPFPKKALMEQINRYNENVDIVWAQQEPYNMGAWTYLEPRFEHALKDSNRPDVRVASRAYSASPATGSPHIHKLENEELMKTIFTIVEGQ